jgi:hypothetical protein
MSIARVQLPDGRIATVEIPDGLSIEQAQTLLNQQFAPKQPEPPVGSAGFSLKDTARAAQQGLYGGLQSLTDLFGAGNVVSKDLAELQQEAAGKMSEERKAEIARRELLKKKAEGNTWEEIKATVGGFAEAPLQTSIGALASSAPIIASAFIPGGQPAAAAGLTGRAALGARALAAAKSPTAGIGALMGVGGQKGQDYEAVKQALLEKNYSEAEAERLAQQVSGYSLENAPRQLAAGVMGGLEGVTGIEGLLGRAGRLGKTLPKVDKSVDLPEPTFGGALGRNILGEAVPEALQAGTGQVGTNIALNQAGVPTDLMQGVAAQVIHDALVGGTLGAATSPVKLREMRQEFVNDEMARKREEDERIAQGRKDAAARRAQTKQQIVGDQPLLLAGPSQELEPVKEVAPLQNPIGNLTPDELGPEVSSYLNQYRKTNGLPRLQSYSIEDVKDAMTAVNPEGEKAALDSILAAKTGYTGQQNFTAKDVENAAIEKNVATGTKGFSDFLARTTGVNSLDQMSEPQLYAAFKALSDMPANTTGQQTVLPEGTNASRFTQKQYDSAVKYVGLTFDENNGKPLSTETIVADIKDSTNLATDRDAKALLDTAINNGDLEKSEQVVYRTFKPDTDQMVATYPTRERAAAAAKKQGLNVREATLTQVAPKAPVTPPAAPRAGLPAGYDITERQFKEGEEPEGYQITSEEGGKPFPTILNQSEVEGKIAQLSTDRREIADNKLQEVMKYEQTVNEGKRELEKLEAAGEFDTDNYKQKKARQAAKEDLLGKRIEALYKEIQSLTAPLKSKPVGVKPIARKGYTITKDGKEVGTFPSREAAEESILAGLSDAELEALVSDKKFGGLQTRIINEQNRRSGKAPVDDEGKPVKTKKVSEVLKDLESGPPVEETPELLAKTKPLRDMLNRFGLGDVALKIVKAIENKANGSYAGKVIELVLDSKQPIRTLRHESLHALKELGFFTDAQWKSLEKMANDKWIKKYLEGSTAVLPDGTTGTRLQAYEAMGLSKADIIEEAIADAFGDFDVNKAPPGLLTALLNKMRNFFESLGNYLEGRGFENSQDIFGAVEKGQLKAGQAQAGGKKLSLIRPAVEGETEISTQNPQGVKRTNDPITDMLSIDEASVREAMKANPDMYKRTVQAIKGYGFVPLNTPNNSVIEVFKQNIINNLLFLHDQVPEDIRERSKLWYDGANRIATDMSKQYGVSMEQVSGIMAAMSPQKDWFQNVSMAERALDILTEQKNKSWDADMLKYAKSYVNEATSRKEREKRQAAFDKIQNVAKAGTTLSNMKLDDAAAFIRAYDEAYNSRQYRIVTPEGGFGDLVTNNDGTPSTMMWSTYDPIKKTVSIFRDGSRKNISEQLGEEHKIRSFYNNIAAPNSEIGHVTIDTHAVAAGLFEALAGTDKEVIHNFGGTGKSNILGVGGTYGIIADAYREAASRKGLKAREMQSITWEAVRGLFGENIKNAIKPKVRAEWTKYREGKQSFNQTREKIIEIAGGIDNPDWVGGDAGTTVSNGGTSYDKAFTPEGGVRLREEKNIREKLTFNLSAVTNSIPGLRELYTRAMNRDQDAYKVLQDVAASNLKFLLSGTNAKVDIENAKGVYLADREPSISVSVSFGERDMSNVMASLAKFADSYNQQQIHVRQETAQKFGHEFGDGSYATAVYEIGLKKQLNNNQISRVIDESGLQGFTITDDKLTAYFVKAGGDEQSNFKSFKERIQRVNELVGDGTSRPKQTIERLYVYGEGDGARIPYRDVAYPTSDIRTKQTSDTATPRIIAEYLNKAPVTTFKQKPLSAAQVKEQTKLMRAFEAMPVNDLKNPLVKRAYNALADALKEQFKVIPIKVELMDSIAEPYANSDAVRRDVSMNNRFKVYATSPETFGPPGANFKGHPLLKDSGLKDVNGKPMLYNDLLRAVHDYFAHNLTETQFGPNGEAAAWRNHMAMTKDPFARWALTSETRAQNAWQNFRPEAKGLSLLERGFADQKAALPPLEFVMTGDSKVDEPVTQLKELLTPEQQRGSAPVKYSLREAPDTPEFKQFFKRSGFINSSGQPAVMYHATDADITEFRSSEDGKLGAGIYLSSVPQYVNQYAPEGNVMPLYASAQNPFILNISNDAVKTLSETRRAYGMGIGQQMEAAVTLLTEGKKRLKDLTGQQVQNLFKRNGYDGIMARDDAGNIIEATVFKPEQVKSATGNVGTYSPKSKDVRYSVRSVEDAIRSLPNGDKIHQAVASKTTAREEKSIGRRILDAFAGESIASLRQQALNRYNQLSVYDKMLADKMGGKQLLADSSAEAAALLSDTASGVAAAAFGVNNVGGAPVYRNGVTVVDNFDGKVKGLMDILMPLAELKDPFAYRAFQFYAASKRGSRFEPDGKEQLFDRDDFAYAAQLEAEYPMFKQVHADWIAYNDKLVDYMVATGIISKGKAAEFTKYADYIPFYRQLEGQDTIGPKVFQSISGVKAPKKLKGESDAPLADFMETIVRNTQSIIQAGMKNTAGQKAIDVALQLDLAGKLDKQSSAPGTVTIMRDGEYVSYAVGDELFINSVKSLNMPDIKLWGIFAGPAGLLRSMVTKDPGFMLANLLRDSMSAYVTSGVKMTPVADTVANFGRAIGGTDPTYQALVKAGILGGYDYAQGVERSGSQLTADLRKRTGNQTMSEKALDGFGLWSTLEKGTSASDAATRMAVYNKVLEDTGNEAEAIFRALEVMNFNRKGSNPMVRLLTAAIPFLNARMQGLDVFYRAGIQPFFDKSPTDRAKAVQKAFFVRGMYMTSLSVAYWAMTHDDDEYLAQEQETRDNNWLIPSMGVKIPIPFEVGVLFKVIPERTMGYLFGDDTGKDFAESMGRAAWSTFGFLPVPQTALPMLEAATNYSFYTGRNIVGAGMEGVSPEFQTGPSTSKVASFLGNNLGISPLKVDHMIKGYTGTIGTYVVDLMDSIGDLNSESPKAAKRFEQMPIIKRFAVDPEAKGTVTAYYKLKDAVDETVRTINLLERTGKYDELSVYAQENAKLFATRHYISNMDKQMKKMREAALQINNSGMTAAEKREALSAINQAQINMTRHIQGVKKMLTE